MSDLSIQQQAQLFRALMHPARIAILEVLREDEACVCHLEAQLGYRQAYVSQHLAVLRQAGLVQDRRDGLNVFYAVVRPEVFALLDTARAISSAPLRTRPSGNPCPCPKCIAMTMPTTHVPTHVIS